MQTIQRKQRSRLTISNTENSDNLNDFIEINNSKSIIPSSTFNGGKDNESIEINIRKQISNNFQFPIDINDTIFTITCNNSIYKEGVGNVISKMIIIKELYYVDLDKLSRMLNGMGIEKLNIFSIDSKIDINPNATTSNNGSLVTYTEIIPEQFVQLLNYNDNF